MLEVYFWSSEDAELQVQRGSHFRPEGQALLPSLSLRWRRVLIMGGRGRLEEKARKENVLVQMGESEEGGYPIRARHSSWGKIRVATQIRCRPKGLLWRLASARH